MKLVVWVSLGMLAAAACGASKAETSSASASSSGAGGSGDPSSSATSGATGGSGGAMKTPKLPEPTGTFVRVRPELGELLSFTMTGVRGDDTGALILADDAMLGQDPHGKGGFMGGDYYNGGAYRTGSAVSTELAFPSGFDSMTPSFDADTPPGTWIEILAAARIGGHWTQDYVLGVWAADLGAVKRHSVDGQGDADGDVATDTLELKSKADALRLTVRLFSADPAVSPRLTTVAAVARDSAAAFAKDNPDKAVWGTVLEVPQRSQELYPNGGEVWCSPTSTSMIAAFWSQKLGRPALDQVVPDFQQGTFDWIYGGAGNWPFNTAHANALDHGTLRGVVTRLPTFADAEALIKAGLPIAISIGVKTTNGATLGHLIVVRGFDAQGDVVVNDPAYPSDAEVKQTYGRAALELAWRHSNHTAYVLWPAALEPPTLPSGALY